MTIIYDFCNVISSCRLFERYMNKYEHLFTAICGGKKAQSGIIHVYESCFTFPRILGLNCTSRHSHGLSELLIRPMGINKPPGKLGLYWMSSYKPSVCVWNGEFIIKSERVFASRTRPAAILETVEYQLIWSYKHRWSSSFGCVSFVQTIYYVRINISAYISFQNLHMNVFLCMCRRGHHERNFQNRINIYHNENNPQTNIHDNYWHLFPCVMINFTRKLTV